MTVTAKALVSNVTLPDALSTTPLYTAVNVTAILDKCTVTNYSAASATFSVYASTAAEDNNVLIQDKTLMPNETYTCPEVVGQIINKNGTFNAAASAATSLNIRVSGREIS
jgi:hypothetical protein